jgi:hypothetical protein
MRFAISAVLAAFAAFAAAGPATPARAEVQYPWCAEYGSRSGGVNCGFVTYQQCLATISGVGGYCYQNPAYPPPQQRRSRRR